jgi:hypothetical protein
MSDLNQLEREALNAAIRYVQLLEQTGDFYSEEFIEAEKKLIETVAELSGSVPTG